MNYVIERFEERYFAGLMLPIGIAIDDVDNQEVPQLWGTLVGEVLQIIPTVLKPNKYNGLEWFY